MSGPTPVRSRAPGSGLHRDGDGSDSGAGGGRDGSRPRRLRLVVGWCVVAALAMSGAFLVWRGLAAPSGAGAPVPRHDFAVAPSEVPDPTEPAPTVAPNHLVIPALGVDAQVQPIGLVDGTLELPIAAAAVGRWTGGAALESDSGTTLVAGHVDTARREPGALWALHRIAAGDAIYVSDGGRTSRWKAVAVRTVLQDRLPDDVWAGAEGERRLVVVTCGGDVVDGRYDSNVIVTAVPAPLLPVE